jgi:hypothetical protein
MWSSSPCYRKLCIILSGEQQLSEFENSRWSRREVRPPVSRITALDFCSLTGCHTLCLLLSVSEGECGISRVPRNAFDYLPTSFDISLLKLI